MLGNRVARGWRVLTSRGILRVRPCPPPFALRTIEDVSLAKSFVVLGQVSSGVWPAFHRALVSFPNVNWPAFQREQACLGLDHACSRPRPWRLCVNANIIQLGTCHIPPPPPSNQRDRYVRFFSCSLGSLQLLLSSIAHLHAC
jgi:hypothetical protein